MYDLTSTILNDSKPHACDIYRLTESVGNDGQVLKSEVLVQSGLRCTLTSVRAKDSDKGKVPDRERGFNLMIETSIQITDDLLFTNFSGPGITAPTAKYRIDKMSTVNPINDIMISAYSGTTLIKDLLRIDNSI